MGLYDDVAGAKVGVGSDYFGEGQYWLRIDRCKTVLIKDDKTKSQKLISAVEGTIIKTFEGAQRPGLEVNHFVDTKFEGMMDGFWRKYVALYFGVDANSMTKENGDVIDFPKACQDIFGDLNDKDEWVEGEQLFKGLVLEFNNKKSSKTPESKFVYVNPTKCVYKEELLEGLDEADFKRFAPGLSDHYKS